MPTAALRLKLDAAALIANFRWFEAAAGVPACAAVKADGYGLGARAVVQKLATAGCRSVAVSSWSEAAMLGDPGAGIGVRVLHGYHAADAPAVHALPWARPVLNTAGQCAAWRADFPARIADLMVDTGMNRLGIAAQDFAATAGLTLDTVHSHLACADDPAHPLTAQQLARFRDVVAATPTARHSLANSAGICWGRDFSFDGVRPGLGLYGGVPHPAAVVQPVVQPEARVIQLRRVRAGESVGYGATFVAPRDSRIAIINLGYADGIFCRLQPHLRFMAGGIACPLAGRISMDMIAVDATDANVAEGDWLPLLFDLPALSAASGFSQYELLVSLSHRYERRWT
jgi:alanine racemase